LQGAWCTSPGKVESQFTLSDPMIHSDAYFLEAPGNFGKKGFEAFFSTHKCNHICHGLGLPSPEAYCDMKKLSSASRPVPAHASTSAASTISDFGSFFK
jgi:hypothetical protein